MSAKFDWSQFEAVEPTQTPSQGFDWSKFESVEKENKGPTTIFGTQSPTSLEEFLSSKPPKGRDIRADLLTAGTSFAGLPGDLASLVVGDNPLTSESLREKSFELFPSLAPQNDQEKAWDEGLSIVMGLGAPGGPIKATGKVLGKGISKLGGAKAAQALKGKYRELFEIGKNLGIDEKALAPFRHGKVTGSVLKTMAKLGEEAKQGIQAAEKLAAPLYETLDKTGASLGPLNNVVKNSLARDFSHIIKDIEKSPAIVKESKDVVNFLKEASENLRSNPEYTAEGLMSLYRQINKAVNWSSIKSVGKGNLFSRAKDAVMKGIYGTSPKLGREFDEMNKIYRGYKELAKEVKPIEWTALSSKGGPIGAAVLSMLLGNNPINAAIHGATFAIGKKGISKISAKLLTDPKWVGMKEKLVSMVKKGDFTHAPKVLQAIKKRAEREHFLDAEED